MPRFLLPSFLPSCHFLTMYFPLLVSRANNGQKGERCVGEKEDSERGRGEMGRERKRERRSLFSSASFSFVSTFVLYVCAKQSRTGDGRGERKNDRRIYRGARKEATGPDQLEVIPRVESPASQSMKFFLSPHCRPARGVALSLSPPAPLTRASGRVYECARGCTYTSSLPCPLPLS